VPSESTDSYFEALRGYLDVHGCPVAFYSDKHSVFRINKPEAKGGQGMTQFGRALAELNIEILCANSSQAKGRVERANRTLQDRLVKELRLAGICDIDAGKHFPYELSLLAFNQRFAIPPAKPEDVHRPLNICKRAHFAVSSSLDLKLPSAKVHSSSGQYGFGLVDIDKDIGLDSFSPSAARWTGNSPGKTICTLRSVPFDRSRQSVLNRTVVFQARPSTLDSLRKAISGLISTPGLPVRHH